MNEESLDGGGRERAGRACTDAIMSILAVGAALAGAACGGGSGDTPGDGDVTPPEIHEVRAMLGDPSPGTLDLGHSDALRVIPGPTPLTVQVFATDDVTATEALKVQAVDDARRPLADQTATLHNGLWQLASTATPGLSVYVAVTDEAGGQTVWPYAAVFPTRAEALVRPWTLLVYDEDAKVVARPAHVLTADSWCWEDDAVGGGPVGGTWSVQSDGRLKLEIRHRMPCDTTDFGSEWDTIESTRTANFYVDATDFSDRPYARAGGDAGTGIVGSWVRTADVVTDQQAKTVTATLNLLEDGTFQQTTADGHQLEGTYVSVHNSDYSADFGDLLVATTTRVDGADVTPATAVHYWTIRGGLLLVDPFVEIL